MFADISLPWSSATVLMVVMGGVIAVAIVVAIRATRNVKED